MEKFNELYITYRRKYVLCLPGGQLIIPKHKDGKYSLLTDNVIRNHLRHKYAVAIFAGESASRFICFDVDDGQKQTVHGVVHALAELGFPRERIYVSASGGKGYHVEMFFTRPVYTWKLKEVYRRAIRITGFDKRSVEFRPTNGNAIKLPLSVHARTGNVCWFVLPDTLEPVERAEYLLEIQQIPAIVVDRIVPYDADHERFDGDPKKEGAVLEATGTRHNLMRNIAVYMRQTGQSREMIEKAMLSWYERQDSSLIRSNREEVMRDINNLLDWVFSERFVLRPYGPGQPICVSPADMRMVMSVQNPSARRILFLLLVRNMVGQKAISMTDIGRIVGVSRATVAKAIARLKAARLLDSEPEVRIDCGDGSYFCEKTRYSVPRSVVNPNDAVLELSQEDIMNRFDDCYQRATRLICSGQESSRGFAWKDSFYKPIQRIDQIGTKKEYCNEKFGDITAYVVKDRVLFPLAEVARLIRKSNADSLVKQCPAKEKWKVHTGRQEVCKNYIEREELKRLLQRSRFQDRQELIDWLCT